MNHKRRLDCVDPHEEWDRHCEEMELQLEECHICGGEADCGKYCADCLNDREKLGMTNF